MEEMTLYQTINEDQAKALILGNPSVLIPYILSLVFDSILLGILLQMFSFWLRWLARKDPLRIKVIVSLALLLTLGVTAFMINWMIVLFVYGFGTDYLEFVRTNYMFILPVSESVIVAIVQIFFAERAYKLNGRKKIILIIICPLILISVVAGTLATVKVKQILVLSNAYQGKVQFHFWIVSAVITDLVLLFMITWGLWKCRTGWKNTDVLLFKLIRLAFETQLPGTIVAIAFMISFKFMPDSAFDVFFCVLIPRIYSISLMVVLNSRMTFRSDSDVPMNEFQDEPGLTDLRDRTFSQDRVEGSDKGITVTTVAWSNVEQHPISEINSINRRHLGTTEEMLVQSPNEDSVSISPTKDQQGIIELGRS